MGIKVIEQQTRVIGRFGNYTLLYFAIFLALSEFLIGNYAPSFNNISTGFIVSGISLFMFYQWTHV